MRRYPLPNRTERPTCIVLAAGDFPSGEVARALLENAEQVICCDSAAEEFCTWGGVPTAIVGDMDSLPDVASAIITVEDAFQAELIPPPHIVNYKDMELRSHGVTGWYFKANDKVYGVVQVNFTYYDADEKESRYDDIYFLIESSSETCVEITRDELLQLQGTNHFIYTHEYDENGKVPGNYIY